MSGAQEKPLNEYVMISNAPRIVTHGDEMTLAHRIVAFAMEGVGLHHIAHQLTHQPQAPLPLNGRHLRRPRKHALDSPRKASLPPLALFPQDFLLQIKLVITHTILRPPRRRRCALQDLRRLALLVLSPRPTRGGRPRRLLRPVPDGREV